MTLPRRNEVTGKFSRKLSIAVFLSQDGYSQKTINRLRERRFSFNIPAKSDEKHPHPAVRRTPKGRSIKKSGEFPESAERSTANPED
jgi:hypothetical protein